LSHKAIAAVDRDDVITDSGSVWIDGRRPARIDPHDEAGVRPTRMWGRGQAVLQFSGSYPAALVREHLQRNIFPN
jgi:hypothetical protein